MQINTQPLVCVCIKEIEKRITKANTISFAYSLFIEKRITEANTIGFAYSLFVEITPYHNIESKNISDA